MFSAATKTSATTGYQISRSLRFNSADSAYLNRTPASAGNKQTWTLSVWVKRGSLGAFNPIYSAGPVSPRAWVLFDTSNRLDFRSVDSTNTEVIRLTTTQVFRDPSAWYHIVVAQDTTQATSSNRLKMYVNGVQITAFDTATYPNQNISNLAINDALEQNYGRYVNSPSDGYLSAYLAETYMVDGQALTPSSFGETNAQTGVWQPKAYSGSYGTNGFYLNFSDNSNTTAATLGKDYSGNGNNWTPNNFSVSAGAGNDSLVDVPTNWGSDGGFGGEVRGNYCTLNPLNANSSVTLSNGNLNLVTPSSGYGMTYSTFGMSSGKWYWEVTVVSNSGGTDIGINKANVPLNEYMGQNANSWAYLSNAYKRNNNSASSYGASFTDNDVIGVALDLDAGTLVFYKNGASQGTAYSSLSGEFFPAFSDDSNGAGVSLAVNFGQRPFAYTAPSGYKALCTQNLPTPTIGATSTTQAGDYFNTALYSGTGSAQSITGVGFQPDFLWVKPRNNAAAHQLVDAVRGIKKHLFSNLTDAEQTANTGTGFTSFDADGFSLGTDTSTTGNTNLSGVNYVAWNWKANGAGSSNTAGSITSTVSANTTSGFSIVRYNGTSANATIGHGLGVAPKMIIRKYVNDTDSWYTYHASLGADKYLALNETSAATTSTAIWQNTAPTSTVFSIGSGNNNSNSVAYCFAEVPGFSAFGSYTGNGSTDGVFVYTGFRPAYILIKRTDAIGDWGIFDATRSTYNLNNIGLLANSSAAEYSAGQAGAFDFLSNGFKLRSNDSGVNASGGTYIFMALASNPFKFSLAR